MKSDFLSILHTKSSECIRKNHFKGRNTVFIPDFFVIISWITIFLLTIVLNIAILYFLLVKELWGAMGALVICSCLHAFCEIFINTTTLDEESFSTNKAVLFVIYFFGYGLIIICLKIVLMNFKIWKSFTLEPKIFPYPIFYVSNENFSILKMFCFNYVALKCIPQIFILCILLLEQQLNGNWFLLSGCILINMLIFSQMMASLLPIRKTPAYYLTSGSVVLNALIKYLATMCACCIQVQLFTVAFKGIRYYAVLVHIVLPFVWLWPCCQVLKAQPIPLTRFEFFIYLILFSSVFSFIYIHPFESQGLFYYYIFYLINLLSEIYCMYMWCNPTTIEITYYFCLKIIFFGLLCCFGMVNISLRCKPPEEKIYIQATEDVIIEESNEEVT